MEWFYSSFIWRDCASWTAVFPAANDKTLFGIVGDICGEDWIDMSVFFIRTPNFDTMASGFDERFEKAGHTGVENLIVRKRACFFIAAGESWDWEVSEKKGGALRGLSSNVLCDITDSDIDRIGCFVATEVGELCFIGCQDDWSDSCPRR